METKKKQTWTDGQAQGEDQSCSPQIQPIEQSEANKKAHHTTYIKNKSLGIKLEKKNK